MPVAARPIGDALGTEITGVDLAHLSDVDFAAMRKCSTTIRCWCFRHQKLWRRARRVRARFGRPMPHVLLQYRHPTTPTCRHHQCRQGWRRRQFRRQTRLDWHADETYDAKLPRLAILHAVEVPAKRRNDVRRYVRRL